MTSHSSITNALSRSAWAVLLIAGMLGAAPARAQDTIEGVLGMLGIMPSDEDTKYPERAPLVVPQAAKLPKPKTATSANDPAWPKDPDFLKKKAEDAKTASTAPPPDSSKSLTPEQMAAFKNIAPRNNNTGQANDSSRVLSPQEMAKADEIMKQVASQKSSSDNNGKGYLTDPPSAVKKKAVITPEIEAATKAATGEGKAWYQLW